MLRVFSENLLGQIYTAFSSPSRILSIHLVVGGGGGVAAGGWAGGYSCGGG